MDARAKDDATDGCRHPDLDLPPWFLELWRACTDEFLSYEDVKGLLGERAGFSHATWECMTALKKYAGVILPYPLYLRIAACDDLPESARDVWYFQSRAMVAQLNRVGALARENAQLGLALAARDACPPVLVSLVASEMLYVLARDGVEVAPQAARGIWLHGTAPVNDAEILFSRLCRLFLDVKRYARRTVTRGMLESIEEELLNGLEEAIRPAGPPAGTPKDYVTYDPEVALGIVCRLANGACEDVMPILALHNAEVLMWDHAPLPALNRTVAFMLRRVCAERMGYPALAFTQFAIASKAWHDDRLPADAGVIPYGVTQEMRMSAAGYDSTAYQMGLLQLDQLNLAQLQRRLDAFDQVEAALAQDLAADARLNDRQRRLLSGMLGNPHRQTTIAGYCEAEGVAYSTGRTDLQSLARMGYLVESYDAHAAVYRSGRTFADTLRRAYGA